MLAAPVLDSKNAQPFGPPSRLIQLQKERSRRGFKPGPFDDAVVFYTGPVETATFYLFVPRDLLAQKIVVVAATDGQDTVFQQLVLDPSMMIPPNTLPPRWIDASGPWFAEAAHLAQHQSVLRPRGFVGVIVPSRGTRGPTAYKSG